MKRALPLFATLAMLLSSGCGNGRAGGPEDPVATGTAGQETVRIGSRTTEAVPYIRKSGRGDGAVSFTLQRGVNLIGLKYGHYDDDGNEEATLSLSHAGAVIFQLAAKVSEDDETPLQLLALSETQACRAEVETGDPRDRWELTVFHKDDLGEIKTELRDPPDVRTEAGGDILYPYQWHLQNSGQSAFTVYDAVAGEDIDVVPVWERGFYGAGVTVAVVDEGVEINHPDLVGNIALRGCWNYTAQSHDTTPADAGSAHGTAVAGIIAASGWNGIGGRGVAPEATLVSYNMLESQQIVDWALGLESLVRGLETVDIYNNSWGFPAGTLHPNPNDLSSSLYLQFANQLAYGTRHGRSGKGAVYVKSAGNDRYRYADGEWRPNWNANLDPEQVERYMIVVGASDADGTCSWYSNPGANLLLNAPGGDTQPDFLEVDHPMIATTDLTGSVRGYDYRDSNRIDYHFDAPGNENYDYTDRMNGTSAAGPIVSGVAALMLEANPELSWRDVRAILAETATKNDPAHDSWFRNGAGRWFSNDYGFGRVNAQRAVARAQTWTPLDTEEHTACRGSAVRSYNDGSDSNLSKTGAIPLHITDDLAIEYVNLQFSLDENATKNPGTLPDASMIEATLTSPAGTVSALVTAPNGLDKNAAFVNTRLGSNAFLDEHARGIWTLKIREVDANKAPFKDPADPRAFKVDNIHLDIYGRAP